MIEPRIMNYDAFYCFCSANISNNAKLVTENMRILNELVRWARFCNTATRILS